MSGGTGRVWHTSLWLLFHSSLHSFYVPAKETVRVGVGICYCSLPSGGLSERRSWQVGYEGTRVSDISACSLSCSHDTGLYWLRSNTSWKFKCRASQIVPLSARVHAHLHIPGGMPTNTTPSKDPVSQRAQGSYFQQQQERCPSRTGRGPSTINSENMCSCLNIKVFGNDNE